MGPYTDGQLEAPVSNPTILVVDDDPMLRNVVHQVLCRGGYKVIVGGGGPDALRIADQCSESIQLLLTDVEMPRMSGVELATRMRQDRPALKVLFMSGSGKSAVGGQPFIAKPFTRAQLLSAIERVLVQFQPNSAES